MLWRTEMYGANTTNPGRGDSGALVERKLYILKRQRLVLFQISIFCPFMC